MSEQSCKKTFLWRGFLLSLDHVFPKCSIRSLRAPQEKLRGSAREAQGLRKRRVQTRSFLSSLRSPFTTATQMYRAVFSVRTELLRSNETDLKKHKLRNRESDNLFSFGDHPNFEQYKALSGVYLCRISFFFQPEIFKHFQVPNRACILTIK